MHGKANQVDIRLTLGLKAHLVVNQLKVTPLSKVVVVRWVNLHPYSTVTGGHKVGPLEFDTSPEVRQYKCDYMC